MPDRFVYVKRGYDPDEADSYIESLEGVIKSYKEKDAAIKNAILNAQIAADNIILNAKNRAETLSAEGVGKIKDLLNSIVSEKTMLNEFTAEYDAFMKKYVKLMEGDDIRSIIEKLAVIEKHLYKFLNEPKNPVNQPGEYQ